MSDDLLQITWTHTNRIVLSKSRPDRSCLSPYSCHMDARLVTHTPHTHMLSVLLSRSLNMMSSSVWLARADYSESTTLSRGHLFLNSQMLL